MQGKVNNYYQKNIASAGLFAMAMLLLVVSCPFKRLLTNNYSSQTSRHSNSKSTNNTRALSIFYSNDARCYAETDKAAIWQADKIQQIKTATPLFTDNIFNSTGYFIHSFSNGNTDNYNLVSVVKCSSIPLFLRHRSILV